MNIENARLYMASKPETTESFPFGDGVLVFKVLDKMFALLSLDRPFYINLKCDPERAIMLREEYEEITPGYHMNKKHWNSVSIEGNLPDELIKELIDHSFDLVVAKLPKTKQQMLG